MSCIGEIKNTMNDGTEFVVEVVWKDGVIPKIGTKLCVIEDSWKEAVIDELVICGIYSKSHEDNPRKAIQDIINWNIEVALDPKVSSAARDLVELGKAS